MNQITIGADIEVFLFDKDTLQFKSAIGLIGGTKENPRQVIRDGFGLQEDNVLLEFTVPPAINKKEFIENIATIKNILPLVTTPYEIKCQASARFPIKELNCLEARRFGCSPDFNAWTKTENSTPKSNTNLRTSGFHVHIGYKDNNPEKSIEIIKWMDIFLGIPSVILDPDTERRQLYGCAGAFRLCSYGCEYRVLSGYFLSDEQFVGWIYDNTILAIGKAFSDERIRSEEEIIRTINTNDKECAEMLIEKYNVPIIQQPIWIKSS